MINEKEVIKTLQDKRSQDPVMDAVLHTFASRQRARNIVTLAALYQRMKEEGFKYDEAEYARVLKMLGELGLGKVDFDSKGRIRSLKDIKVTLQSIGLAAVGQSTTMDQAHRRNRFQKIPIVEAAPVAPKVVLEPANYAPKERVQPRPAPGVWEVLCVRLADGSTFKTYVPPTLTKADAALIGKALSDMAKGGP